MKHPRICAIVTMAVAATSIWLPAQAAQAAPKPKPTGSPVRSEPEQPEQGFYRIRNAQTNKCLSVSKGSKADNATMVQWSCINYPDQKWYLSKDSYSRYRIINLNSGKCAEVWGAVIQQYTCNYWNDQAIWEFLIWEWLDNNSFKTLIWHPGYDICMAVGRWDNGAPALTKDCNWNAFNQRWIVEKIANP